jgi:hypothetical protein
MKKLIMLLVTVIVAVGFTGCKEETTADKVENKAEETEDLVQKKTNEFLDKARVDIEQPKK